MHPRHRLYVITFAVIAIAVVALFLATGVLRQGRGAALAAYDGLPVPPSLLAQMQVQDSVANSVGIGAASYQHTLKSVSGAEQLNASGKPEILYMGAEYCPFCAAQRWAMVIALSRFGTFGGLKYMTSSATDYSPSTPTFTFYNSTYTSSYVTFVSVEMQSNIPANGTYPLLQRPTAQQQSLMGTFDPSGSIPFMDFANQSVIVGALFDPLAIDSENWTTIASRLSNPSSLESQEIIGSANLMTAQICQATGNQPQSVCGQPYVSQIEALLSRLG